MPTPVLHIPEWELTEVFIRSAGPGGQNVNKVSTGVQLRFHALNSPALTTYQKNRIRKLAKHLLTKEGELVIEATRFRSQAQNRAEARRRLAALIEEASKPPPRRRIPTKPTKGSIERRLKQKTARADIKQKRGRPKVDE